MSNDVLFLKPCFATKVWGGNKLAKAFNYELPGDKIGEAWVTSGISNMQTVVTNGDYAGTGLGDLYKNHRELFGKSSFESFPLLVKIIDAKEDLSIQVHPNDKYAYKNESGSLGKSECWFILDCELSSKIVYGHNAKNKKELVKLLGENKYDELLKYKKVRKGDFLYIPSGTVHALTSGIMVLEVQQSSDVTYRIYDYDRMGLDGKPRELHLNKAIDVINTPFKNPTPIPTLETFNQSRSLRLVKSKEFSVYFIKVQENDDYLEFTNPGFLIINILSGNGKINNHDVAKGDNVIITTESKKPQIKGKMDIIVSHL